MHAQEVGIVRHVKRVGQRYRWDRVARAASRRDPHHRLPRVADTGYISSREEEGCTRAFDARHVCVAREGCHSHENVGESREAKWARVPNPSLLSHSAHRTGATAARSVVRVVLSWTLCRRYTWPMVCARTPRRSRPPARRAETGQTVKCGWCAAPVGVCTRTHAHASSSDEKKEMLGLRWSGPDTARPHLVVEIVELAVREPRAVIPMHGD